MLPYTIMRQQLIILLTHVEKIRYYYLMDNRFLNREIEAYNTSIKNFTDSLPLTLSLIHISEPTRQAESRMPSSA